MRDWKPRYSESVMGPVINYLFLNSYCCNWYKQLSGKLCAWAKTWKKNKNNKKKLVSLYVCMHWLCSKDGWIFDHTFILILSILSFYMQRNGSKNYWLIKKSTEITGTYGLYSCNGYGKKGNNFCKLMWIF